jgi:hypothetical protein
MRRNGTRRSRPSSRQPYFRPCLEELESRLAPSTTPVDVLDWRGNTPGNNSGANLNETQLTPQNVNPSTFGLQFTDPVDGQIYGQPLIKTGVNINGVTHNVVFVATEHDSVYAFDADTPGPALWHVSFLTSGLPGATSITTVPSSVTGSDDITPEIGITDTPVIDPTLGPNGTLFVVSKTAETVNGVIHYVQRLHALDITSGAEEFGGPVLLGDTTFGGPDGGFTDNTPITVPGTGDSSSNGIVHFNALRENERDGLFIDKGVLYLSFTSHGDTTPYHGWLVGYQLPTTSTGTLQLASVYNTTPDGTEGAIWMGGGSPAVDANGDIYFTTGNGTFDANTGGPDYGMSTEKVSPTPGANGQLPVLTFFTPHDEASLSNADLDQGSGGVLLLPTSAGSAAHPNLVVQTGKTGRVYLLDANNLGGFTPTDSGAVQILPDGTINGGSYDTPAYFNNGTQQLIYYMGQADVLKSFTIANGQLSTQPFAETSQVFGFPGANPMISANGTQDGIVWVLDTVNNGTGGHPASGPAVLHAYDATTLKELYNTTMNGTLDQLGDADKFVVPTVANGKVYVATQTGLYVLGLFPPPTSKPAAPSNLSATATGPNSVTLNWTNNATNARAVKILRSDGNASDFVQIAEVSPFATTFTDTSVNPATKYFYEVVATNALGDSGPSNRVNVLTPGGPPTLQVTATGSSQVNLAWTPTAGTTFNVLRSTDGVNFSVIATVPAHVTSYVDTGLSPNVYYYEVEAFDQSGGMYFSNVVQVTVGEPVVIDHSSGFASHSDLTANGSATFINGMAQLTDGGSSEAGTIFSDQKTDIRNFTTTFTFQFTDGTSPTADGMTFIIQPSSPTAIGGTGGGLGYGPDHYVSAGGAVGITPSVAIKFDLYSNEGEGVDSTGIFTDGRSPTLRDPALPTTPTPLIPDESVDLSSTGINFHTTDVFQVTLSYNGTTLTEKIVDTTTGATVTENYAVDIPDILGSDTAYVGFGGGTGGLTVTSDVQSWKFTPTTGNLPPLAPTNLKVANVEAHDANTSDVTVTWTTNSYNETGYEVWRSTDGVNFTQIATLAPNSMSFTDSRLTAGTYYYKVRAFNANGESLFTNVDSVIVGTPNTTVTAVDDSAGFNNHSNLTANGSATFFPNEDPVGQFAGHMDIGTPGDPSQPGSATFNPNLNGGTYTLTASGSDIWGTADHMQYVYMPLVGDGTIVARLDSASAPDYWTKAGLMIRDSLTAGAANDFMLDTPNPSHQEPVMQFRDTDGGQTADTDNHGTSTTPNVPTPIWLKLVRSGNTFTGYWAVDNNGTPGTWNLLSQSDPHTTVMPTTVYVGLALTAHNNGAVATATFDHVTVTGTTAPLPPEVAQLTDGNAGEAGSVFTTSRVGVSNFNTTFTLQFTDGTNPTADGMAFVLQSDPRGPQALGPTGGGLGYGADTAGVVASNRIVNSIAIKFDLYSNSGEGIDSTGLFVNGDSPTVPTASGNPLDTTIDLSNTGINFHTTDVFQVNLSYDGTTLTETITDETLATHPSFTTSYKVDIPTLLGDNVGYAGFTGGTGGLTVTADVKTWTYSFTEPGPGNSGSPTASTSASSSTSSSGTGQAALASVSSSTQGTNNTLMSLPSTPVVPNGSTNFVGNLSSLSSGWSAFQATTTGPIVRASDTPPPAPAMDPAPSELPPLDQLFTDLGSGGSLDPLALDSDQIATA